MAERSVVVTLRAQVDGFKRAMREAGESAKKVGKDSEESSKKADTAAGRLVQSATKNQESWDRAGATLTAFGVATTGALVLSAKAAIDWESAFAGVRKTVDGSDAEMAALEGELRNLAKTLPATHQEIAAVAEAAGQLGVRRQDIIGFTRTMIDLGESTNLSADEAATSIAQFANVMGTAGEDVDNLGSALVALGNDGASTERDIILMAQRIAGAGKLVGATEADVLALSNAMASVGITAELGGGVISRVMQDIYTAVKTGGDAVQGFADVSGMSAEEFTRAFEADPVRAMNTFIQGLNGVEASGGNVVGMLKDLGFRSTEEASVLLRLKGAGDLLTESLDLGSRAWEENNALALEASRRYETTASQLQVAKNNVTDAAIAFGEVLLPAIKGASEGVAEFADWMSELPDPIRNTVVGLGGVAGGASLAAGAFLLTFPRVIDTVNAFKDLRDISPRAAGALGTVGKAAGAAVAIVAVTTAVDGLTRSFVGAPASAEQTMKALLELGTSAKRLDDIVAGTGDNFAYQFTGIEDAAQKLTNPGLMQRFSDFAGEVKSFGGQEGADGRDALIKQFGLMGDQLGLLVQGGQAEEAARQFEMLSDKWVAGGGSVEDLKELLPGYSDALAEVDNQQKLAAGSSEPLTTGFTGIATTAEDAEKAMDDLSKQLRALFDAEFAVEVATDAFEQGLHDLTQAAKDNGKALDGNSEEALANREAMRSAVDGAFGLIDAMARSGASADELARKTAELKQRLYDQAIQAGYSREAAQRYADSLDGIPGVVNTIIQAQTADAMSKLNAVSQKLAALNGTTADVAVRYRETGGGTLVRGVSIANADGGVWDYYADGGFSENHVAQFAPAGANRVWAEPETGGEAYIPLAASKRDRSVAIWEETGARLGLNFMRFADGGFWGGSASQGSPSPIVARLSTTDMWELARAVSQVTLSLNGRAVSEQMGQAMTRAGAR